MLNFVRMKKIVFIFLVPAIFFLVSFITLSDYGVSWDEPEHFLRGQGYLNYFLTGEKRYSEDNPRPSYYQDNSLPAQHFFEHDNGHPPLNDILAASSNFVFYQKLGILGDIESYHLFNIACATLLVFVVSLFAYKTIGGWGAVVAGLVAGGYPLLFSEGHFNIKDPPQAAFYTLTIFAFWMSLNKGNWKWLVLSAVAFAFSFGMKFNILFLPLIVVPYLLIRYWKNIKKFNVKQLQKIPKSYRVVLLLCPIIVLVIFYAAWPFLWADPIENLLIIFKYYKEIGTGFEYQPGFYAGKFNLYPLAWIVTTTQPVVLVLLILGICIAIKDKTKEKTHLLWLIWFLMPILRVTTPGFSIYGGVRQIMEYIPALALLCGLGFSTLVNKLNLKKAAIVPFLIIVIGVVIPLVKYHPHQNVYFNFLIGGLKGASEKNIPYWGNSYGNAYLPILKWMNENSEQDAHLALIQGTALNIPAIALRSDITRWNSFWSGVDRKGEYMTELTYGGVKVAYPYAWDYVENFLEPVYEVKVDGVTIAALWKNDLDHTKESMKNRKEVKYINPKLAVEAGILNIELREEKIINRLVIKYKEQQGCIARAGVKTSSDLKTWRIETESIPADQISERKMVDKGVINYYFPGKVIKGIQITPDATATCLLTKPIVEIYTLE